MSYTTKNGKLEKEIPHDEGEHILRFHAIADMRITVKKVGEGKFEVKELQLDSSRIATRPEHNPSKEDLAVLMQNDAQLLEASGLMLAQQQHQRRNPKVVEAKPGLARVE